MYVHPCGYILNKSRLTVCRRKAVDSAASRLSPAPDINKPAVKLFAIRITRESTTELTASEKQAKSKQK